MNLVYARDRDHSERNSFAPPRFGPISLPEHMYGHKLNSVAGPSINGRRTSRQIAEATMLRERDTHDITITSNNKVSQTTRWRVRQQPSNAEPAAESHEEAGSSSERV